MGSGSQCHIRHLQEALPASWTPLPPVSSLVPTLPPITALSRSSYRRRISLALSSSSPPSSHSISSASGSSPSLSRSWSGHSSPQNEPQSPCEGQPLLSSTRNMTMAASHSSAHRGASSVVPHAHHHHSPTDMYGHSYHHHAPSQQPRHVEDGSHLWGDGMKGIWNSLTGAPHGKSRSPRLATSSTKGEHLEPARASDVEAATSIWDIPRDTVAMTMGFQGSYDDQAFQQHQVWQQQQQPPQQQQQQQTTPYSAELQPSYSSMPAPSGLAGATASDVTRSRGNSDVGLIGDRHYARGRPSYQHGRSNENFAEGSHAGQWWPAAESHAAAEDASSYYGNRRLQPPPLPETRSASRPTWSNPSGFEISGYEFPQSTLGKRQYDEEAMGGPTQGSIGDAADSVSRRYSLTANASFSRPSAPISGIMNGYRPSPHSDPRRPSLPSDQYTAPASSGTAATPRAAYSNTHWSPWSQTTTHAGVSGSMTTSSSSPNMPAWRDPAAAVRYGIESGGYSSPSGLSGGIDKRQQRDRSSSSASAVQQANVLANTPFHITTDIVLRAPAGSKMEDVYYDQHCELRIGMADPPASDFEVENEDDRPRRQTDKLRFPGDLYTPRWVRGSGNAREAWCDRCESGNWLQLKNSQYWYDQVHKHGISSVSGLRFTAPTHLKVYADAAGTVEAKCHQCKEWVLICTAKRRRNFAAFFKHAHACHSYRKASAVGNGPYVEHNPGGHRNSKKSAGGESA